MQISTLSDDGSTARIALTGKLDIQGADVIAIPLAALSGAKKNVVIDMSGVNFIASIGIRHLVSATKTLSRRGGRLVLLKCTAPVFEILQTSGITSLIATATSEDEVRGLLGGGAA
jgi:anti-anti-sigma factor